MNRREIGTYGEDIATSYLKDNGFYILERNYRTKLGEIDIIGKTDEDIVFVEVKSRKYLSHGYPAESVNVRKQQKITNVAKYYMMVNNLYNEKIRFDVVEIYLNNNQINHIKGAF